MSASWAILATALAIAGFASCASCAPTEATTPHGYVIAPSVPADAGIVATDGG